MNSNNRWQLYPQHPDLSQKISGHANISPLVAQLLLNRSVTSLAGVSQFLKPEAQGDHFPADSLHTAFSLLKTAIDQNLPVQLYGDYDVDGITSTSIFIDFFQKVGFEKFRYHIPHRFQEGYGLTEEFIKNLALTPPALLITLDCGISNFKELTLLKTLCPDTKILILDHHLLPDPLPPADAILNPKALTAAHRFWTLCTVGIAYEFLKEFALTYFPDIDLSESLDLVAIGTIADVAELTGANRYLVQTGLSRVAERQRFGIKALLEVAQLNGPEISPRDVGFSIAPRLNAAGRLSWAKWGVSLLTAPDYKQAIDVAHKLQRLNEDRQQIGQYMVTQAKTMVQDPVPKILALAHPEWHAGVIGITASQLARTFCRPTVLMAIDGPIARASCRSWGEVDLYAVLATCKDYFIKFGGHRQAAGFTIETQKIPAFQAALQAAAETQILDADLKDVITIDTMIKPDQLNLKTVDEIHCLEPFGQGNPEPIFYANDLEAVECRTVGNGAHVKATFVDHARQFAIGAIGFDLAPKLSLLHNRKVELAFSLTRNEWQDKVSPQLNLVDIK